MKVDKTKWEYKKLGDICQIQTGKLDANAKVENGQYPFFTCDYKPYRIDKYAFDTEAILISGNGSLVGHVNYYNGKFNAYQRTYVLTQFKLFYIPYLIIYLKRNLRPYIIQNKKGGCIPYITLPILKNFKILYPSLYEQRDIAAELDAVQKMIEGYKAQLADLDALAQSIFLDMFGDPITNPKGWEKTKLSAEGTIIGGATPRTDNLSNWDNGIYYWITPAELNGNRYYGSTRKTITDVAVKNTHLTLLPIGTVLLSSRAPIGKVGITTQAMYCNQGFKNIICGPNLNNEYLYQYLLFNTEELNRRGNGVTFKEISKKIVEEFPLILPPLPLQQQFAERVESIERQKELLQAQLAEAQTLMAERMQYYFD